MTKAPTTIDEQLSGRATITVEEAATLLGIGRSAAYEAARRGQLPTRRLGKRLRVPVPALLDWLRHPTSFVETADEPVGSAAEHRPPATSPSRSRES